MLKKYRVIEKHTLHSHNT